MRVSRFRDAWGSGVLVLLPLVGPSAAVRPANPAETFSAREILDMVGNPQQLSWAGKYAAKLAVAELLALPDPELPGIEILQDPCRAGQRLCRGRHRPFVQLDAALSRAADCPSRSRIALSITHESTAAVALVVLDHRDERCPAQAPAIRPATPNAASSPSGSARPRPE